MKKITLKAKSSSGEYYDVEFEINDAIRTRCNCRAGTFNKICKHKTDLLDGKKEMLFDENQEMHLKELATFVKRSEYSGLLAELDDALNEVERAKKRSNKLKQ
ncbi:MAG: hypothetical protein R6W68_06505 [Ignavibacteriaceae bacterium]